MCFDSFLFEEIIRDAKIEIENGNLSKASKFLDDAYEILSTHKAHEYYEKKLKML